MKTETGGARGWFYVSRIAFVVSENESINFGSYPSQPLR